MRKRYAVRVGNDYGSLILKFDISSKAKALDEVRTLLYEAEFLQDTNFVGIPRKGRGPQSPGFKSHTIEAAGFYVDVLAQLGEEIPLTEVPLYTWMISHSDVEPLRVVELNDPESVRTLHFERVLFSRTCQSYSEHVILVKYNIMDQMQKRFAKHDMTKTHWFLKRSRASSHVAQ